MLWWTVFVVRQLQNSKSGFCILKLCELLVCTANFYFVFCNFCVWMLGCFFCASGPLVFYDIFKLREFWVCLLISFRVLQFCLLGCWCKSWSVCSCVSEALKDEPNSDHCDWQRVVSDQGGAFWSWCSRGYFPHCCWKAKRGKDVRFSGIMVNTIGLRRWMLDLIQVPFSCPARNRLRNIEHQKPIVFCGNGTGLGLESIKLFNSTKHNKFLFS